jgi:hypothetical protein
MSNNIYKFTSPNDTTKTTYRLDQVVANVNVLYGAGYSIPVRNDIATYYGDFPRMSNFSIINNSNFDKAVGTIGYKINGTDLGNIFPAKIDYYNATFVQNQFVIHPGATTPVSNYVFNNTSNNSVTIENCFNHISAIVCGGGGGGGYSNSSGNGGYGGQGGGGGGWCYAHRISLTASGRTFTIQCGGGGYGGVWGGSGIGYAPNLYTSAGGGNSYISSSNGLSLTANGGNGGQSQSPQQGNTGTPGTSSCNFSAIEIVTLNTAADINVGTSNGADDSHGTYGGDCMYSQRTGKNSTTLDAINHNGNPDILVNNNPGVPAEGSTTFNSGLSPVTYSRTAGIIRRGGGGGGASGNNSGNVNNRPGHPGAPGAPGYVIIYKYLS